MAGTVILFYNELKIINSIKKLAEDKPIYYMEIDGDYHFEDFLKLGGASANVDEAIAILKKYDIFASGGISHHFAISDATGASVAVEFMDGELVIVNTNAVTNFNLAIEDISAGGESSKQRFEYINSLYKENGGLFTGEQAKKALERVSQKEGNWITQWSIVFEQSTSTVNYYFDCDFEKAYSFSICE